MCRRAGSMGSIACALVTSPILVLTTEPTGNMDSQASRQIMDMLTRLNTQEKMTIVLVTHEPEIAQYAHRVITMKDGIILSDRPVAESQASPVVMEQAGG